MMRSMVYPLLLRMKMMGRGPFCWTIVPISWTVSPRLPSPTNSSVRPRAACASGLPCRFFAAAISSRASSEPRAAGTDQPMEP